MPGSCGRASSPRPSARTFRHRRPAGAVPGRAPDAAYWTRHIRQPVQFAAAIRVLAERGCDLFLEIGPRPTLGGLTARALPGARGSCLTSLRWPEDDRTTMLSSLAVLYTRGLDVDLGQADLKGRLLRDGGPDRQRREPGHHAHALKSP